MQPSRSKFHPSNVNTKIPVKSREEQARLLPFTRNLNRSTIRQRNFFTSQRFTLFQPNFTRITSGHCLGVFKPGHLSVSPLKCGAPHILPLPFLFSISLPFSYFRFQRIKYTRRKVLSIQFCKFPGGNSDVV